LFHFSITFLFFATPKSRASLQLKIEFFGSFCVDDDDDASARALPRAAVVWALR